MGGLCVQKSNSPSSLEPVPKRSNEEAVVSQFRVIEIAED